MIFGDKDAQELTAPTTQVNEEASQINMHPLSETEIKKSNKGFYVITGVIFVLVLAILLFLNGQSIYNYGA